VGRRWRRGCVCACVCACVTVRRVASGTFACVATWAAESCVCVHLPGYKSPVYVCACVYRELPVRVCARKIEAPFVRRGRTCGRAFVAGNERGVCAPWRLSPEKLVSSVLLFFHLRLSE